MLRKNLTIAALAVLLLAAAGCTNNGLDDGSAPDVEFEVQSLLNNPVTAQNSEGLCTVEIVDWVATIKNVPKNSLAGSESQPYNDIRMYSVTIEYAWIDAAVTTPTRVVGLGNVTIPADGTNDIQFSPIAFDDLTVDTLGKTCNLTLTFEARTVEGTAIRRTVTRQLFVEQCA
jgi:hypothetical protein